MFPNAFVKCLFLFVSVVADDVDVCEISACQALEQSQINLREFADNLEDDNINDHLTKLERRLRALEQPSITFYFNYFSY